MYLPWDQVDELEVSGPGTVTTGGGWMGGGFGLEGAIQGIIIAEVLNAVTTKQDTVTLLYLSGQGGGVALHTPDYEPETLRIRLAAGFGQMAQARNKPAAAVATDDPLVRLERLADARKKGLLSNEEYKRVRAKIIGELT